MSIIDISANAVERFSFVRLIRWISNMGSMPCFQAHVEYYVLKGGSGSGIVV